ncbi:wax ester/triacylglycerol synthase domain-containing protein [Streptomyces sp. 8K308]|uniref:wax ester/triacylglycerol synthase domain-containing protein n=1 Tax=Streptomyces sp. 8K308 TaxID=2530388 RepID=UPI0014048E06|nr:wax ester/triacylglycerol synthase domain-containing protein [Streptomyces sp. 8K308]
MVGGTPKTIGSAMFFAGRPPGIEELRELVAGRFGGLPRLRSVLLPPPPPAPAPLRRHRWLVLDDFDPVLQVRAEPPGTRLADLVEAAARRSLPGNPPPWRLRLVPRHGPDGFALLLTAHHAALDGRSLETLFGVLLDGPPAAARTPAEPRRQQTLGRLGRDLLHHARPSRRLPGTPAGPTIAWTDVDPAAVRAARRSLPGIEVGFNDVLLATVTGVLREVHGAPSGWPGGPRPLYALVPVDLRPSGAAGELGNALSATRVPLPIGVDHPRDRLAACHAALAAPGFLSRAVNAARLVRGAALLGAWAPRMAAAHGNSASYAPVCCSSLVLRRGPWSLLGRPLTGGMVLPDMPPPGVVSFFLAGHTRTPERAVSLSLTVISHAAPPAARLTAAFTVALDEFAAGQAATMR